MNLIPKNIDFDLRTAKLPATYDRARAALAECVATDECKSWADKAEALRAYAKMQDDKELENMAKRIKARAIERAGELMAEFQARGARTDKEPRAGSGPRLTQGDVARKSGFSERQEKQARNVASIPKEKRDALIDGPNPPNIAQLAEIGKREKTTFEKQVEAIVGDRDPKDFS